jgi:hypothetical protein
VNEACNRFFFALPHWLQVMRVASSISSYRLNRALRRLQHRAVGNTQLLLLEC